MTFATKTIQNKESQIFAIEHQIKELQEKLTDAQNKLQIFKSVEQAGLSAIAQFKAAYQRIYLISDGELASSFLDEFKNVIAQVQEGQPEVKALPEVIDIEAAPAEPVPPAPPEPESDTERLEEPGDLEDELVEQERLANLVKSVKDMLNDEPEESENEYLEEPEEREFAIAGATETEEENKRMTFNSMNSRKKYLNSYDFMLLTNIHLRIACKLFGLAAKKKNDMAVALAKFIRDYDLHDANLDDFKSHEKLSAYRETIAYKLV